MEKQIIYEELKNCPAVLYDPDSNKLELVGKSIPENPEQIYKFVEKWIDLHFEKNDSLDISIYLEYINSDSSKYLYDILKKLTLYIKSGKEINLNWLYEEGDESMFELGEHYRDSVGVPLQIEMVL